MKTGKKVLGAVLAAAMALSSITPVFAADKVKITFMSRDSGDTPIAKVYEDQISDDVKGIYNTICSATGVTGIQGDGNSSTDSGESGSTDGTTGEYDPNYELSIGNSERKAYEYFIEQGMTREGAIAVMANIRAESGFDPNAVNEIGAYGMVQWLEPRTTNLKKWCRDNNYEHDSVDGQIAFCVH